MKNLNDLSINTVKDIPEIKPVDTEQLVILEDNQSNKISEYMISDSNFVGYENQEQQESVYNLATFGIITPNVNTSITEFGCGRGDLCSFILKTINPNVKYTGVDVNQLMIDIGKTKYPDYNLITKNYHDIDINTEQNFISDWVFNVINLTVPYGYYNGEPFQQFVETLEISLENCNHGVVFILLNNKSEFPGYIQYDTSELIQHIDKLNLRYAVDNTDFKDIFRLVIFKNPF